SQKLAAGNYEEAKKLVDDVKSAGGFPWIAAILVVLAAIIGGAIYWYVTERNSSEESETAVF
ncbi:MAG: hypothetical protein SVV03_05605, partial [Candidatus Nanohaloarchaea archaeon]|nr:hypothetical protein [Candidatus Nanohaloarchaea archaeon]